MAREVRGVVLLAMQGEGKLRRISKRKRSERLFFLATYNMSLFLFCKSLFLSYVGTKERKGGKRRDSNLKEI
jgi:hypothetical protein